jgi:hypothetical protein
MPKFLQIIFAVVCFVFTMSGSVARAQEPQTNAAYNRKIDADIVACRNNELFQNHLSRHQARHIRAPHDMIGPDGKLYTMQAHENFTTICRAYVKKTAALLAAVPATASLLTTLTAQPATKLVGATRQLDTPRGLSHSELNAIVRSQERKITSLKFERDVLEAFGLLGILSTLLSFLFFWIVWKLKGAKTDDHEARMALLMAQTSAQTATQLAEARANDCASLKRQLEVMERDHNEALAEIERLRVLPSKTSSHSQHTALNLPAAPKKWSGLKTTRLVHLELSEERFKVNPVWAESNDPTPVNRVIQLEVHLNDEEQPVCNFFISDSLSPYRGGFFDYTSNENALAEKLCGDELAVQKIRDRNLYLVRNPKSNKTGWFNKPSSSPEAEMLPTREQLIQELGGKVSTA